MKIANNILELIGNTPIVKADRINSGYAEILMKLEYFNPTGSVKDRAALAMLADAEAHKLLKDGCTIIEPTSGNTGIALALVCAIKGYKLILTMPDTMSIERRKLLTSFGAKLVLTEGLRGMKGAIEKAIELKSEMKNSYIAQQFENFANPEIHEKTTAEEIWRDTDGKVDIVVAGVGTGGTISGIGHKLKLLNSKIEIVAVEPDESAVLSGEKPGSHKIQGIGAGFVPKVYDAKVVDKIIRVKSSDAGKTARALAKQEGVHSGVSAGAAMFASLKLSKLKCNTGKRIVVIIPDSGMRYLSTWLYSND